MSRLDRVIQAFPFRGANTGWRRAGFINHLALAPLAQQYPAWSWFPSMRNPEDGWRRTWAGAVAGAPDPDQFYLGGVLAEWRTVAALEEPNRPCDQVRVYYTPDATKAFAVRRDQPPTPFVGRNSLGVDVYYTADDARTMMGAVRAERLVECVECPPHPSDPNGTEPRQAWLKIRLNITTGSVTRSYLFDAQPAGCTAIAACADCLFQPSCPPPYEQLTPFTGLCAFVDPPGVYYYNNKFITWEFCGWYGTNFWTGVLECYPAQCQDDDSYIGAMFNITWASYKAIDTSQIIGPSGVLGFDPDCGCGTLETNRYPSAAPQCQWTLGDQWGYPYIGSDVCRPRVSGAPRNTDDDVDECWGLHPALYTNSCTGGFMDNYTVSWQAWPS